MHLGFRQGCEESGENLRPWADRQPPATAAARQIDGLLRGSLGLVSGECFELRRNVGYAFKGVVHPVLSTDGDAAGAFYQTSIVHFNQHTVMSMRTAIEHCRRTLELHPHGNPDAYVTMAYNYAILAQAAYSAELPDVAIPLARSAANSALVDQPNLPSAYGVLGLIHLAFDYDWNAAEAELGRALDNDPNDTAALLTLAHLQMCRGQSRLAIETVERAVRIDPTDKIIRATVAWMYLLAGQTDVAYNQAEEFARVLFPEFPPGHIIAGWAAEAVGNWAAAEKSYKQSLNLELSPAGLWSLGHVYGRLGRTDNALGTLRDMQQLYNKGHIAYVPAYGEAMVYAGLRKTKECLDSLEVAFAQRCDWLIHLTVEPKWNHLRGERRFRRLVERVGIPSKGSVTGLSA